VRFACRKDLRCEDVHRMRASSVILWLLGRGDVKRDVIDERVRFRWLRAGPGTDNERLEAQSRSRRVECMMLQTRVRRILK